MKSTLRLQIMTAGMFGSLLLLVVGLFQTQVIRGGYYRRASEQNRIRLIRLEAPRGNIVDRKGALLATSRAAYHVYAIPEDFEPRDISTMGQILELKAEEIRHRLSQTRHASFTPVLLKQDVPKEIAMKIEERRPELAGIFIQIGFIRTYPLGEVGSNVIGYIGKISPEEYRSLDPQIYHFGTWIGRAGMERAFDSHLRGEDGGRQLEVNARGIPIRLLGEVEPRPGKNLHLAIDAKLEVELKRLASKRPSAILVMDLELGRLLAAVTNPGFDPNAFVTPGRSSERLSIIGSKSRPLLDRGFNGLYPPGSIFKLVTAMAALETGTITPQTTFTCPGYFRFGPRSRPFKCWFEEGHGRVDLYTALERSCNVYFYNVGRLLGEKRLAEYARKLGFGSSLDLELPTAGGLVPDREWKKARRRDEWYPGETISFAIGQSYLLVSPLQILRLVSAIATDGRVFRPKLLWNEESEENETDRAVRRAIHGDPLIDDEKFESALAKDAQEDKALVGIRPETFRVLRQGMLQAVSSDRGTAQLARINFAKLAAKTGTAQAPPGDAHAWFGGFFPFEDPKIAMVVFVERGKSGGITAARIAKKVAHIWNDLYGSAVS